LNPDRSGANSSVFGYSTTLQAGRFHYRWERKNVPHSRTFQTYWRPGVHSASNSNQYQEPSWLTTSPPSGSRLSREGASLPRSATGVALLCTSHVPLGWMIEHRFPAVVPPRGTLRYTGWCRGSDPPPVVWNSSRVSSLSADQAYPTRARLPRYLCPVHIKAGPYKGCQTSHDVAHQEVRSLQFRLLLPTVRSSVRI
jgi:hypothetical protein